MAASSVSCFSLSAVELPVPGGSLDLFRRYENVNRFRPSASVFRRQIKRESVFLPPGFAAQVHLVGFLHQVGQSLFPANQLHDFGLCEHLAYHIGLDSVFEVFAVYEFRVLINIQLRKRARVGEPSDAPFAVAAGAVDFETERAGELLAVLQVVELRLYVDVYGPAVLRPYHVVHSAELPFPVRHLLEPDSLRAEALF